MNKNPKNRQKARDKQINNIKYYINNLTAILQKSVNNRCNKLQKMNSILMMTSIYSINYEHK